MSCFLIKVHFVLCMTLCRCEYDQHHLNKPLLDGWHSFSITTTIKKSLQSKLFVLQSSSQRRSVN